MEEKKLLTHSNSSSSPSSGWVGDDIPAEKLEALRVKMGLSQDQMKEVMDVSKQEYLLGVAGTPTCWNASKLLKTLNKLVYIGMFIVLIYVLNRDYDNIVTIWFVRNFPREARVFGIQLLY